MTDRSTHTLDVPGATLTYDVRPNEQSQKPVLVLIGTPMAASGFDTLSGLVTDRTIVTYDPRGSERSQRTDGSILNTPEEHADDVSRVIAAVSTEEGVLLGSSGETAEIVPEAAEHIFVTPA